MSIPGLVIGLFTRGSAKRFEEATRDPARAQKEKILDIVRKNANTEYGKRYDFRSIRSIQDYQKRAPLTTYEDIRSDVDRMLQGQKNILTAEEPVMFAQTSGTTGDSKFIPVTPTCQGQDHKDVTRTWIYHLRNDHPGIYGGKILTLVSPAIEGYAPSGTPFGSTSGEFYKKLPGLIKLAYSIPYDVFEIADYTAKYYAIMRISLAHDVRLVGTANPSSVLKMCEKANEFSENIIRDIRDGTLSPKVNLEPQIRTMLERKFRPDPKRARRLEELRDRRSGRLLPADYWPELSVITCWMGGTVGHYIEKFWPWFDPDDKRRIPIRDLGYLSSEARGSIPLRDNDSSGVLTVGANFFEFVEPDDLAAHPDDPTSWNFLTVADIEEGKEYYIFLTTTGGLYRYDINDVVKVTGRYNNAPEIVFLRKGRGMTNLTGEKVSVNQVITAFDKAAAETAAVPDHFKAEADLEKSRYLFRVEFTATTGPETRQSFLQALDKHLKEVNIEYKTKRDSQRLGAPVLHVMREGWYERERRRQVESGKRAFQAKTELLSAVKLATMAVQTELVDIVEMDS